MGKIIAFALWYADHAMAIKAHVGDENKGVGEMPTPGGKQIVTSINESGLYALILSGKLPVSGGLHLQPKTSGIAAAKARGVRFGRPPRPLLENFHGLYQQWKNGKTTCSDTARLCGMPISTFRYRAEIYEKATNL